MTEVAVTEALGESLSPSQVTYLTCPAKWYFRYLVGLSERPLVHRHWASSSECG
jgi:hypothetical protein